VLSLAVCAVLSMPACSSSAASPMPSCGAPSAGSASAIDLSLDGTAGLAPGATYTLWLASGTELVRAGDVVVDASGGPVLTVDPAGAAARGAGAWVGAIVTAAGAPDAHLLAGCFDGSTGAQLSALHPSGLGAVATGASGRYTLATPTDGPDSNERSGLWFLGIYDGGSPEPGLTLSTLAAGLAYEGWAVVSGVPISTGRFGDPGAPDGTSRFGADLAEPPFPGEDFLRNAPTGVTFPTELRGATVLVTIEAASAPSTVPSTWRLLDAVVPDTLADHESSDLTNGSASWPALRVTLR